MTRLSLILSGLYALLPTITAADDTRYFTDEAQKHITRMCMPNFYDRLHNHGYGLVTPESDYLADSIFPCEQVRYIGWICTANGTSDLDLLAQQQCLCDGDYFDAGIGCAKCHFAHGQPRNGVSDAELSANYASLSSAECVPTPPFQRYGDMLPTPTWTTGPPPSSAFITLGPDKFPNDTAVTNYLDTVKTAMPGKITGSATGRHTDRYRTDSPTVDRPIITPTKWESLFEPVTVTETETGTGAGTAAASTTTETKNAAALPEARAAGGIFACVLGLAVLI